MFHLRGTDPFRAQLPITPSAVTYRHVIKIPELPVAFAQVITKAEMQYLRELKEVQFDCCLKVCNAPSPLILLSPNSCKTKAINLSKRNNFWTNTFHCISLKGYISLCVTSFFKKKSFFVTFSQVDVLNSTRQSLPYHIKLSNSVRFRFTLPNWREFKNVSHP